MEELKQVNFNSHAYKNLYSTTTALLQIAGFDCIDKIILDQKMALYNFSPETRNWFHDYMSNCSHYVVVGAKKSSIDRIHKKPRK